MNTTPTLFPVALYKDPESQWWVAQGTWTDKNHIMVATLPSLDALMLEVKLCISDLFEIDDFDVEYTMTHHVEVRHG